MVLAEGTLSGYPRAVLERFSYDLCMWMDVLEIQWIEMTSSCFWLVLQTWLIRSSVDEASIFNAHNPHIISTEQKTVFHPSV
ncbi:hypothetical protein JTB14_008180 [Gonioctena quinquepunctata]|nr:hypothetical protein JTB14_008180 [Gonioctena quinquepunctata]